MDVVNGHGHGGQEDKDGDGQGSSRGHVGNGHDDSQQQKVAVAGTERMTVGTGTTTTTSTSNTVNDATAVAATGVGVGVGGSSTNLASPPHVDAAAAAAAGGGGGGGGGSSATTLMIESVGSSSNGAGVGSASGGGGDKNADDDAATAAAGGKDAEDAIPMAETTTTTTTTNSASTTTAAARNETEAATAPAPATMTAVVVPTTSTTTAAEEEETTTTIPTQSTAPTPTALTTTAKTTTEVEQSSTTEAASGTTAAATTAAATAADPTNASPSSSSPPAPAPAPQPEQPPPPPQQQPPKKHPEIGRTVERPKILPTTGQFYPLQGTIVDYYQHNDDAPGVDSRIPSRFIVRYNHNHKVDASAALPSSSTNATNDEVKEVPVAMVQLQDEWTIEDLDVFDETLKEGTNPSALYNKYTTTNNKIKSQTSDGLKVALSNLQQRYQTVVEHTYSDTENEYGNYTKRILTMLVMMAAFEESLQSSLQQRLQEENELQNQQHQPSDPSVGSGSSTRRSTRGGGTAAAIAATNGDMQLQLLDDAYCPKYYTTNPSVYLIDPSKMDSAGDAEGAASGGGSGVSSRQKTQMTPTVIAQRVRQGCQWAWTYLQAQQQPLGYLPPPPTLEAPKPPEEEEKQEDDVTGIVDGDGVLLPTTERRRSSRATSTVVRDIPTYNEPPSSRRSTRSGGGGGESSLEQPVPTPVHRGGRVALWWLQTLQNGGIPQGMGEDDEDEQEEEEEGEVAVATEDDENMDVDEDNQQVDSSSKKKKKDSDDATTTAATSTGKDEEEVGTADSYEQPTTDDDDDDNDDEDFQVDTGDEDDEELEDVERERQKLSPLTVGVDKKNKKKTKKNFDSRNGKKRNDESDNDDDDDSEDDDEEEDDSEEEEEVDEEDAIVYNNPYLQPSMTALLESLAGGKSISMEDIQSAMADVTLRVRHNKRFSEFSLIPSNLPACDQIALDLEDPDHPSRGTVVLKCVSGDTYGDLQRYDANTFSRCRFELDVIGEMEAAVQVQRREAQWKREVEYKERKAWDRWRFRGIQEGYCTWPSWGEAADRWAAEHVVVKSDETQEQTSVENGEVGKTDNDEALARSLEESEPVESSGRRRNTRRAAGAVAESVYYGNQSQLTLKQLSDALLRLVKATPCQTLMKLLSTVGDDSSDPMRRLRTSIGKMIWKRNLICRKSVTSTTSDAEVTKLLEGGNALLSLGSETEGSTAEISHEDAVDFTNYIQRLHVTELYLRELVLDCIATVPIPIIACAADERPGSMENMDRSDFEDSAGVSWSDSGNVLIGKQIFRPPTEWSLSTDLTACYWYTIKEVSDAVESEADDAEEFAVERRMRFRAVPSVDPNEDYLHDGEILLLTEAQVNAGMTAADMELKRQQTEATTHAFASSAKKREKVVLVPNMSGDDPAHPADIHGQIVGHDTCVDPNDPLLSQDRILVLPSRKKGDAEDKTAFWAVLGTADDGSAVCTRGNDPTVYTIENSNYGPDSEAFQMCQEMIEWLKGNPKIGPFLVPVDPVALGIPGYFDVIKHPMDISTVEEKLEKGVYSNFAPSESRGKRFPVSLMLNGPFRDDVELIFNNAQDFNPEDDWIHKAAKSLKQAFIRKIRDVTSKSEAKALRNKNLYVDDDSDFDMQELDDDDEEYGKRGGRKRKRGGRSAGAVKDEPAAKAIEHPIRLQNSLRGGDDLRGPFARLPVTTDANTFSLPEIWTCKWSTEEATSNGDDGEDDNESDSKTAGKKRHAAELEELLSLQQAISEDEASRLRRSTRAHDRKAPSAKVQNEKLEFVLAESNIVQPSWYDGTGTRLTTRLEVELAAEKRHEEYYSRLYQLHEKNFASHHNDEFGKYSPSSFPPFLGRVIPGRNGKAGRWEVRSPYVVPALRWVIRGLIQSGHLTALEPMTGNDTNSGVILTNDVYYYDSARKPFEVLDTRELQRKKRSDADGGGDDESEDEVELSEYEQLRAERMARNQERLRMLGLA